MLRILAREAVFGFVLYGSLGRGPVTDVFACVATSAVLVLLTRRRGLLNHKDRMGLFVECFVIFCGALLFRNLLLLTPSVWASRP